MQGGRVTCSRSLLAGGGGVICSRDPQSLLYPCAGESPVDEVKRREVLGPHEKANARHSPELAG